MLAAKAEERAGVGRWWEVSHQSGQSARWGGSGEVCIDSFIHDHYNVHFLLYRHQLRAGVVNLFLLFDGVVVDETLLHRRTRMHHLLYPLGSLPDTQR